MKKIIVFLFLIFFIVIPQSVVFADENGSTSAAISPAPTTSHDYQLPYPGILPDNPLYVVKAIRDKIVVFFISDPQKKSLFALLQSDKRLEASWYLLKKDVTKQDLAISTLTKSTNYLLDALVNARIAKSSGENVSDLKQKIHDATVLHMAITNDIHSFPGIGDNNKNAILHEANRLKDMEKSVVEFSNN